VSDAVQLPEPAADLLAAAAEVTEPWIRRALVAGAAEQGVDATGWPDLDRGARETASALLERLAVLLATDVDEQRTNPLSLYRAAIADASTILGHHGVPVPAADPFAAEHFPDDHYRLGPATWSDVDETLHQPGLAWGAWKALTVLQRRRDEGRR
jgi:hypothetical protein